MHRIGLGLLLAAALTAPARAADYQANLGPMPLDDETKAVIAGRGEATARLDGRRLVVQGRFRDLPSRATEAQLFIGPQTGVPGTPALKLQVAGDTSGTISGTATLTPAQVAALRTGRLYLQLNSEKAPPGYSWGPKGTLWGWLLPAHPVAVPGEPQAGPWFIPDITAPAR
jgi:hypothetical protein